MSARSYILSSAVIALGLATSPAFAGDTGLASIHDLRREGGRLCMDGHYHYGNGGGKTKAGAQSAAVQSWQDFTAFEYGTDWASFKKAANKRVGCNASGSGFDCQVEARPCK